MPPPGADLVELLADPAARRFDLRRRGGKVGHSQVDVGGHDRLARCDSLKREPRPGPSPRTTYAPSSIVTG